MRLVSTIRRFRILKDWEIKQSRSKKYLAQSSAFPDTKTATIYQWGDMYREKQPCDYIFHEVLHIAFRALEHMDKRKPKEKRQAEEELVQDICSFIRNKPKGVVR